jgi:(2Fe-2S) ferredoxin
LTVRIPGAVWYDALDPAASGMAREMGLPKPRSRKQGKGTSYFYDDVTTEQAQEIAEHLRDRGELMLANSEPWYETRERTTYRAMIRTAERILAQLGH